MFIYLFICLLSFFFCRCRADAAAAAASAVAAAASSSSSCHGRRHRHCWSSWLVFVFLFLFAIFCSFWPLKRRSIMAGNDETGGRNKKKKSPKRKKEYGQEWESVEEHSHKLNYLSLHSGDVFPSSLLASHPLDRLTPPRPVSDSKLVPSGSISCIWLIIILIASSRSR